MNFDNPEETALEGINRLEGFLKSIGMPQNFTELGASEKDIERMADTACYGNGRSGEIGGFMKLKKDDVEKIYRLML